MAIAAANMSFDGNGPSATGQILASRSGAGNEARRLIGTATFTGDGASTSATLNYIDGTAVLGYAPSVILASRSGGSAAAAISVVSVVDNADNGKTAVVNFSAAPAGAATVIVSLMVEK